MEEPIGDFPAQPKYRPDLAQKLEAGMVFEIEPSVIDPNLGIGTTMGCPVLVTKSGYRVLSKHWKPEVKIIV